MTLGCEPQGLNGTGLRFVAALNIECCMVGLVHGGGDGAGAHGVTDNAHERRRIAQLVNRFDTRPLPDGADHRVGRHHDLAFRRSAYDLAILDTRHASARADIDTGRCPVVAQFGDVFGTSMQHFVGDLYAAGASLLSGKLGEKVFSDKLSVSDDLNPETSFGSCFFDAEGCVAKDYRPVIIEKGVLKGLLTTKKTAEQYGLPNAGCANAPYDGVPSLGFHGFWVEKTAESMKELVPGKSILVLVASGGDTTPDGHFATPVQLAFLLEDGKMVGRLPDIQIGGSFFDMLGKDYIGTTYDWPFRKMQLSAITMDVTRN